MLVFGDFQPFAKFSLYLQMRYQLILIQSKHLSLTNIVEQLAWALQGLKNHLVRFFPLLEHKERYFQIVNSIRNFQLPLETWIRVL